MKKFMDYLIPVLLWLTGVISCYLILTYTTGKKSAQLTEDLSHHVSKTDNKIKQLEALILSNIQTVGNANARIEKIQADLVCYTGVADKRDLEYKEINTEVNNELDNLLDHCSKLKEQLIDQRELISKLRPLHKHVHTNTINVELANDIKKKLKEVSK